MLVTLLFASALSAAQPTPAQFQQIGRLIFLAECDGQESALTSWNNDEDFPSLGIGHFIWYHERRGPYEESFPKLVEYLENKGVPMPAWTKGVCPWKSKAAFDADKSGPRLTELRRLLASTFEHQTAAIIKRREEALPNVLSAAPAHEQAALQARLQALSAHPVGLYATIDYVNFKGEGLNPSERYPKGSSALDHGWGLLQVLRAMDGRGPANQQFADACKRVLARRVANAPADRREAERKWLGGWQSRCGHYGLPTLQAVLTAKGD